MWASECCYGNTIKNEGSITNMKTNKKELTPQQKKLEVNLWIIAGIYYYSLYAEAKKQDRMIKEIQDEHREQL